MVDNKRRKKKGGCIKNGSRPPCGKDCPKNMCDGNCDKKLGHFEKHKCNSLGHRW